MMDDADELIPCPYNQSHILHRSRMQTHLVKCKRAHEHPQQNVDPVNMKICPYNTNHHVPASQLEEHAKTCTDRSTVERFLLNEGSVVPYTPIELPPADENWDKEDYNSTYDPEQHVSSAVIIRQKQGVPKSVRKTFRMQERERINRLREDQEAVEKSTKIKPQPPPTEVHNAFSEHSLRQPRCALLGMGRGRILQSSQVSQNGDAQSQGHHELQDIPTMRSKATESVASTSKAVGQVAGMPWARSPVSDGVSSPTLSESRSIGSPVGVRGDRSNSLSDSGESYHGMGPNGSDDGFVQQISKRNKKKAQQLPKINGHVPSGSGQPNNPLISSGGSLKHALPGQPGRGRGRLNKN